jgi:Domain of unknown function (DUF4157)/Putative peptidoglycan binding domain
MYEQEADAVADQVVQKKAAINAPITPVQLKARVPSAAPEEALQKKEQDKEEGEQPLQRKGYAGGSDVPDGLESTLQQSKGSGSTLPKEVQLQMGTAIGADFSDVKIHTGQTSVQMNQQLNAQAFTHGSDIYFNSGKYDTNSSSGQHLLAHELTHVVQQGSGLQTKRIQRKPEPDETLLPELDKTGAKVKAANLDGWYSIYGFYNIFVTTPYGKSQGIFPGAQPNAYANHIYAIQKIIMAAYGDKTTVTATGILDELTMSTLLTWAGEYKKSGVMPGYAQGIDTAVFDRLLKVEKNKVSDPPKLYSVLRGFSQFQEVNANALFSVGTDFRGDYVLALKRELLRLGYMTDDPAMTNVFDAATKAAVIKFQTDMVMDKADGIVGQQTLRMLDKRIENLAFDAAPGMKSAYWGDINQGLTVLLDVNGDQKKEIKLEVKAKGKTYQAFVTHLDTKEKKGPFSLPLEHIETGGKRAWLYALNIANGGAPLEVIVLPEGKKAADCPSNIIRLSANPATAGAYQLNDNALQFTPASILNQSVFSYGDDVVEVTPSIEAEIGLYRDRFRFVFQNKTAEENSEATDSRTFKAQLYYTGLAEKNTAFGGPVPLKISAENLSLTVVDASPTHLGLDTDGDGKADIEIRTTMKEGDPDHIEKPDKNRIISLDFSGSALDQPWKDQLHWINGKYEGREIRNRESYERMVASAGNEKISNQPSPASINAEIIQVRNDMMSLYLRALENDLVMGDTLWAWLQLQQQMTLLRQSGYGLDSLNAEQQAQLDATAAAADQYYTLIRRDTAGSFRNGPLETYTHPQSSVPAAAVGSSTSNPYSGEYTHSTATAFGTFNNLFELEVGRYLRERKWDRATSEYSKMEDGFNLWIADELQRRFPEAQNLGQIVKNNTKLANQLETLSNKKGISKLKRLKGVFFPYEEYLKGTGLPSVDLPLYLYYDDEEEVWYVEDFINPYSPFKKGVGESKETAGEYPSAETQAALFAKLDDEDHLPDGYLLYSSTDGILSGKVEMTTPWKAERVLAWVAAIAGLAALGASIILSGGATTPLAVEVLFVVSAVAGIGAASISLYKNATDHTSTGTQIMLDTGNILANMIGLGAFKAGKLVVMAGAAEKAGAPLTGSMAQWAALADRVYIPLTGAALGLDGFNFAILSADSINKLEEIENGQYIDDAAKKKAILLLIGQLCLAGSLTIMSVKGNIASLGKGRNIILKPGPDGIPVAYAPEMWYREAAMADIAGKSEQHFTQSRAIRETLVGDEVNKALKALKDEGITSAVRTYNTRIYEVLADPNLSVSAKQAQAESILAEMEQFVKANPKIKDVPFNFTRSRELLANITEANFGMRMIMKGGKVFVEDVEMGSFASLVDRVKKANTAAKAAGEKADYVIITNPSPKGDGSFEVMVLTREPWTNVPSGFAGEYVTDLGRVNPAHQQYIIDVGSGGTSFALDTIKDGDMQGSVVLNTEYAPVYMDRATASADFTWKNAVPNSEPNTVGLIGDPLKTMNQIAGDQTVRQVFINNVNAGYQTKDYEILADQLLRSMDKGGRVMVQWDSQPEIPGDPGPKGLPGSREHITGDELKAALIKLAPKYGRTVRALENLPTVDYKYGIQPSTQTKYPPGTNPPTKGITMPVPEKRTDFIFN